MDFCSEIAVLQSAVRFAASKLGSPNGKTDTEDVGRFSDLISPAIQEILNGLEDDRTPLDRSVWSFKLASFFFTQILEEMFNNDKAESDCRKSIVCEVEGYSEDKCENDPVERSGKVFHQVPCLSFSVFLELVKRFEWHGHLLECLELIGEPKAVAVVSSVIDTIKGSPADVRNLEMMITCLKYLTWYIVKSTSEKLNLGVDTAPVVAAVSKWFTDNLEKLNLQESSGNRLQLILEMTHVFITFSLVFVSKDATDLRLQFMKSQTEKEMYQSDRETTKVLNMLLKTRKCPPCDGNSFEVVLKQLHSSVSRTEWVSVTSRFLQMTEKFGGSSGGGDDALSGVAAKQMTLDLGLVDINMENLSLSLMGILKQLEGGSEVDDKVSVLLRFLTSVDSECSHQKEESEKEKEARKEKITLEEMINKKMPGYEDSLEKILCCCDINSWTSERYEKLLTVNSDVLFRESHVCSLHQTLRKMAKVKGHDQILLSIQQILLDTFSKLPILTQEKIILDNFLLDHADILSSVGNFSHEMNVTFNQFTSEASEKQLLAVLRLCLIDPVSVMECAVATAVKSTGQIPVVLKIFHSVPDLCRCSYGNHHPERSLLCHVTSQFLLANTLNHNEERNLIKFITTAIQSFTREVCGYKLTEPAVLSPAEFASAAVLPFIGVHKSADHTQPIGVELALKLFICLLEKKRDKECDWLIGIQLQTLLLCLCEILHECVVLWDSSSHVINKHGVKQLCLRCLHLLQTKWAGIFSQLHGKAADWLISRTKDLDWSVLIHLQKTLYLLGAYQGSDFNKLIENLAGHVAKHTRDTCLPLLRFASITDETLEACKKCLHDSNRVISPDVLTNALVEILPNLLLSEWKRVVRCLWSLLEEHQLAPSYRLVLSNKIPLVTSSDVRCQLCLTQLLTDVAIVTASDKSAPASVIRHVATCYVTVLQEQTKLLHSIKEKSTECFLICQMFSHVTVAMTAMDSDQSEPLFVFLLSLLDQYVDLQTRRVPHGKGRALPSHGLDFRDSDENLVKAIALLDDEGRQETFMKKLSEKREMLT